MNTTGPAPFTPDDYTRLLGDDLGLDLTPEEISADFDELPDWDSLHLLKLVTALEKATGTPVPVGKVLEARTLRQIYELAVTA
ncbi:acyl carrier protein [Streptomyces sp. NBC_01754]|uniref:acyl carrier protein n=1 Tax=Streptomyces sp. NBC_01754 TaxID=2975930 RepID=UPI002DDBBB51|nr:acyl carrier protein [Streptomyces sp. NBC_01754]WSC95538.1 acyl carrier protein [Streptomyces sp. NBC_01754]